jgi:hypothetical protein
VTSAFEKTSIKDRVSFSLFIFFTLILLLIWEGILLSVNKVLIKC